MITAATVAALVALAALTLGGCAQATDAAQAPAPSVPTATGPWTAHAKAGETVTTPDGVQVQVVKVQRFTIDRHWFDAGPAVAVTVVISNATRQAVDVSGVRVLLGYGPTSQRAQGAFSLPDGSMGQWFDGTVLPGSTGSGLMSFRVPAGPQQLDVEVDLKDPSAAAIHFSGTTE